MKKAIFEEQLYKKLSVNDLILFAISDLKEKKCAFDDLAAKCFIIFPKVFQLRKHSKWPDTRKLDRPLRSLRRRDMITGNPKGSFSLTAKGKKRALEISKIFRQA